MKNFQWTWWSVCLVKPAIHITLAFPFGCTQRWQLPGYENHNKTEFWIAHPFRCSTLSLPALKYSYRALASRLHEHFLMSSKSRTFSWQTRQKNLTEEISVKMVCSLHAGENPKLPCALGGVAGVCDEKTDRVWCNFPWDGVDPDLTALVLARLHRHQHQVQPAEADLSNLLHTYRTWYLDTFHINFGSLFWYFWFDTSTCLEGHSDKSWRESFCQDNFVGRGKIFFLPPGVGALTEMVLKLSHFGISGVMLRLLAVITLLARVKKPGARQDWASIPNFTWHQNS